MIFTASLDKELYEIIEGMQELKMTVDLVQLRMKEMLKRAKVSKRESTKAPK